jgi:hypothetical protein
MYGEIIRYRASLNAAGTSRGFPVHSHLFFLHFSEKQLKIYKNITIKYKEAELVYIKQISELKKFRKFICEQNILLC